MLSARGVTKRYGSTSVIDNVTLSVNPGEILFLTGPSGCGKSTMLRLLSNLDVADRGQICLEEKPMSEYGYAMWRALVTYVPQSRTNMTGTPADLFEKVLQFSSRSGTLRRSVFSTRLRDRFEIGRCATLERFVDVAKSVGLERTQLTQSWNELSGGQAQRASVALAMATAPAVILLDEATSACDIKSTVLVEHAVRKCGAAVVWVSHDPTQPARVGGRVYSFENAC